MHALVQRLVSGVKLATLLEVCATEEWRSAVRFYGQKYSMQTVFIKKCPLFTAGSVSVHNSVEKSGKGFAGHEEVETEVAEITVKGFHAASFDAQV
jgi:hypothetical protein